MLSCISIAKKTTKYLNHESSNAFILFTLAFLGGHKRKISWLKVSYAQNAFIAATAGSLGSLLYYRLVPRFLVNAETVKSNLFLGLERFFVIFYSTLILSSPIANIAKKAKLFSISDVKLFSAASSKVFATVSLIKTILNYLLLNHISTDQNTTPLSDDFDTFVKEFKSIEAMRPEDFVFTDRMRTSPPDATIERLLSRSMVDRIISRRVDVLNLDVYRELSTLSQETILDEGEILTLDTLLRKYSNTFGQPHLESIKFYLEGIFTFLRQKKKDFLCSSDQSDEKRMQVINLIKNSLSAIIDAHRDCEDQMLSQIWQISYCVHDQMCNDVRTRVSMKMVSHIEESVKLVLGKYFKHYQHLADADIFLQHYFYMRHNIAMPRRLKNNSRYFSVRWQYDYFLRNKGMTLELVMKELDKKYESLPSDLVKNCTTSTNRDLFAEIGMWYCRVVAAKFPSKSDELAKLLGADFEDYETNGNRKDSAILYALWKHGCIKLKS